MTGAPAGLRVDVVVLGGGIDAPPLTPRAALHIARRDQRDRLAALGRNLPRAQALTGARVRALA